MQLSALQRRAFGCGKNGAPVCGCARGFFGNCLDGTTFEDDELQSLPGFVEMGLREPNDMGTGRNTVCAARRKLAVAVFDGASFSLAHSLANQMSAFFRMEVAVLDGVGSLKEHGASVRAAFGDASWSAKLRGKKRKHAASSQQLDGRKMDVLDFLGGLIAVVPSDAFALLAIVPMPIAEGPNEIGGRAYGGDRVACVTTSESEPREVIATALHEVCHCFGLDHCVAWHCLMASLMLPDADGPDGDKDPRGAGYAKLRKGAEPPPGGRLWLCPLCEAKLLTAVGKPAAARESRPRYEALATALEAAGLGDDATWARQRLAALDTCGVCSEEGAGVGSSD